MDIQQDYLNIGNEKLYYQHCGEGLPLVMIHGNMLDMRMWDLNFDELAKHCHAIRYDMRGFGRSGQPNSHKGAAIEDLTALLDHLSIEKTMVCGASMGGVLATHFALTQPERTAGMILVDSDLSGFPISSEMANSIISTHKALSENNTQKAVDIWLSHQMLSPTKKYPEAFDLLTKMVNEYTWRNWMLARGYLITPSALKRLHEITADSLIITGENDMNRFQTIADKMVRDIPNSKQMQIAETAHLPCMEQPKVFNEIIIDFITNKIVQPTQ